jgi:hypothetical protein
MDAGFDIKSPYKATHAPHQKIISNVAKDMQDRLSFIDSRGISSDIFRTSCRRTYCEGSTLLYCTSSVTWELG